MVPESKGIPIFRNINVFNVTATNAKKAINAIGVTGTILQNFKLTNLKIAAATAGSIDFAHNWSFDRVEITAADGSSLKVTNSKNVKP